MSRRRAAVVLVGATLLLGFRAVADDDQVLLQPKVVRLPADMIEGLRAECESKGTPEACYNVAVDYAQTQGDEVKAVEYLRPLCKREYVLGCFNLGGILIKEIATRKEGLPAFQKACLLAKAKRATPKENDATASACQIAEVVAKNMGRDYTDLAVELGIASQPRGASFDCAKASTHIEKMICGDRRASDLDFWVASYYRSAVQLSEEPDRLKAEQRAWLSAQRNSCADVTCLRRAYEQRFAQLRRLNEPEGTAHPNAPADDAYPGSFVRPPFIRPSAVERLTGSLMSDEAGPKELPVLAIDLTSPKALRRWIGKSKVTNGPADDPVPYVYEADPTDPGILQTPRFGYRWRGRTISGVDVLLVDESGGGSGIFECVLLVKVELDASAGKKRLLLRKIRVDPLGDRWEGDLRVIGNKVLIGEDTGRFADDSTGERRVIDVHEAR